MFTNIEPIKEWKERRNDYPLKSVIVVPRRLFKETYDLLSDCEDIAFISIECIEEALWGKKTYRPNTHLVPDSELVLNIDFDDVEKSGYDDYGNHWKAIDENDGKLIAEFIERNLGKHFVVHCTAGRSRSQGVRRVILDMFPEIYGENEYTLINPCLTPNHAVMAAVRRPIWEREFQKSM